MIEFHTANTSNAQRVAIMLAECGFAHNVHKYDLFKGEHDTPEFRALNPACAVPVIVDSDGPGGKPLTLSQSFAILMYLAEKAGKFCPTDTLAKIDTVQWMMQAATDVAPSSANIFFNAMLLPDKSEANGKWFVERAVKHFRACEQRLQDREYLAGEISLADFSLYPNYKAREDILTQAGGFENLKRWAERLGARPGVQKGMAASRS